MADPFMGELRLFSFNFPPKGWAHCNGQLLPINQNQALFSLLGTMYGGDGRVNFALPNLRGRVPIHLGSGFTQGQAGGKESHTVTQPEMPTHIHIWQGTTNNADAPVPTGNRFATANNLYATAANLTTLHPASVANTGGSQPHENRQPYRVLNYCIALLGIFPSRN
jgi:microcystin-dependent protein